jgi:hypothetical protein
MHDPTTNKIWNAEFFISVLALIISAISLGVSIFFSSESARISSLALATARQANDIAAGRLREYPRIDIHVSDADLSASARTDEELRKLRIVWNVWNTGTKIIIAFGLQIIAIPPLTYSLELIPMDERRDLGGLYH